MSKAAPPPRSILKRSLVLNLFIVAMLTCLAYVVFFASLSGITHHGDDIKVPAVMGKDGPGAVRELESLGFEVHIDSSYVPGKKPLLVLLQMPDIGDVVKKGRTLFLTLNRRTPPPTPMPNLVGKTFRSAELILRSSLLVLGDTAYKPDIAQGAILEQLYNGQPIKPGQIVPQGSRISLVIGNGLGETELNVPDVIGLTYPEAVAMLNANGLQFTPVFDDDVRDTASAKIYDQTPTAINDLGAPTRIRQGDFMDIRISQNPADSVMENNRDAWKRVLENSADRRQSSPPDSTP